MAIAGAPAQAAALEDVFKVRGYATLGVVHSDEDQADFAASFLTQPEGAGFSNEYSFDVDSKFGVQLDINLTPRLAAVVQLVSESNDNNSYDGDRNKAYQPSLEWANVSYRISDNLTVRAGRVVLPFLMVSEYRKVGYANHWVRPPVEVYGQQAFTSSDGADISFRSELGSAINTLRAHYGVQSVRTVFKAQVETAGINDTLELGALSLRGAYMNLQFTTTGDFFGPLFDPFIAVTAGLPGGIGSSAAAAATRLLDKYEPSHRQKVDLFDIGAAYDPGQWFALAEVVHVSSEGIIGKSTAGYVSGGYRWNGFTPYLTVSLIDTAARTEPGIPLTGLPAPLQAFGGAINGALDSLVGIDSSQVTMSAGVRWDIAPRFALKGQYDRIDLAKGSTGLLPRQQPGFAPGSNVNLISIAVDYVF
jgi:hypothetical protein